MKKKIIVIALALIVLVGSVIYGYRSIITPISSSSKQVLITVSSGDRASSVLKKLKQNKLIKNEAAAKIYIKVKKPVLVANTYALNTNMTLKNMFDAMSSSKSKYIVNTKMEIKDGVTIPTLAKAVANATDKTEEEVLRKWSDQTYLKSLISKYWFLTDDILKDQIKYPLEGYLYPDTYYINDENPTIESVTKTILDAFEKNIKKYKNQIEKSSYSVHEIITLTSIVEKESLFDKDLPKIAGVFINRLNKDMLLQSDITVNYALDRTGVNVSTAMTRTDSPYNTYKYKGLPIGPVSSIQMKTLNAVLNPESSDYLYFFAKQDGTVIYTKTYAEHQKVVQENKWY